MSSEPSRSSHDPVTRALASATADLIGAVRDVGASNPVVLIDGRSGSGKSTLAQQLVAHWPLQGRVQLVALDALYPGWDGLADGTDYAFENILVPHARGMIGVWQRWDWDRHEYAEASAVDPSLPLIVEGAGVLTRRAARIGDVRVWVEAPALSRRSRALERDGETFRPHWERWAAQEVRHIERNLPVDLATRIYAIP